MLRRRHDVCRCFRRAERRRRIAASRYADTLMSRLSMLSMLSSCRRCYAIRYVFFIRRPLLIPCRHDAAYAMPLFRHAIFYYDFRYYCCHDTPLPPRCRCFAP